MCRPAALCDVVFGLATAPTDGKFEVLISGHVNCRSISSPRFSTVGLRACRATTGTQSVDLALLGDELHGRAALRHLLHELHVARVEPERLELAPHDAHLGWGGLG